jgi:hypothetical protein
VTGVYTEFPPTALPEPSAGESTVPREFKFRKEDGRKKKRREGQQHWVEETRVNEEVVHKEVSEGDPDLAGIHEIVKQVNDDLSAGKITPDEAKRRLSGAVERLTAQASAFCVVCEKPKQDPASLTCDPCGEDVVIERSFEIEFDRIDED